jgi:DNA polymerase
MPPMPPIAPDPIKSPATTRPEGEELQPGEAEKSAAMASALADLKNCRLCLGGEIQPLTARPGRIGSMKDKVNNDGASVPSPKLFVVGDYRHGGEPDDGCIFGPEEDELLAKMLTDARSLALNDEDLAVTNLIKCRLTADSEADDAMAERCLPHLRRQLLLAGPRLILLMGALPARILLAKNTSPSALRGRLHNFFVEKGRPIPVLVSYHPRFLLAQTEMKKAAWEDLKMARRFLASLPLAVRGKES